MKPLRTKTKDRPAERTALEIKHLNRLVRGSKALQEKDIEFRWLVNRHAAFLASIISSAEPPKLQWRVVTSRNSEGTPEMATEWSTVPVVYEGQPAI